eukprot:TRINITY_DN19671_c0_g1_i1.p1 TRINITY_DN19671_c0_g1~~TRINITY_DN19671_c0_g1_i1.p1  ORF type:complete len:181 (-),score=18.62 TRINITY_DN19671_c0_g1_i1:516-1058(-)
MQFIQTKWVLSTLVKRIDGRKSVKLMKIFRRSTRALWYPFETKVKSSQERREKIVAHILTKAEHSSNEKLKGFLEQEALREFESPTLAPIVYSGNGMDDEIDFILTDQVQRDSRRDGRSEPNSAGGFRLRALFLPIAKPEDPVNKHRAPRRKIGEVYNVKILLRIFESPVISFSIVALLI